MPQRHHTTTPAGRTARDRARRSLSQNFLADPATIRRFARSVGGVPGNPPGLVVEIGAGDGRITTALAEHAEHVIAYEIDPRLARRLRARCHDLPHVRCVQQDFLKARPPHEPFHLAGNIPYSATSRIVSWTLNAPDVLTATFITQLEYARKRTGDYGRWSLLTVQNWPEFTWRLGGRIDRGRFRPVPRVDAGILRLDRRPRPLIPLSALDDYRACVALGFQGKGGTLRASLRRAYPRARVDAAFRAARLDAGTVVAHAYPDQWITLFRALHRLGSPSG